MLKKYKVSPMFNLYQEEPIYYTVLVKVGGSKKWSYASNLEGDVIKVDTKEEATEQLKIIKGAIYVC